MLADVALEALVTDRMLLAAIFCFPELVALVLCVLLFQCLHGRNDQLQGFVSLLWVVYDEGGVLLLFGSVIYRLAAARLLHFNKFGHVGAEE